MTRAREPAPQSAQTSPLTIAHRAGNDLSTLAAAFDSGAEYAEADVWWHRGRLEVRHDRVAGPLPVVFDRWRLRPRWRVLLLRDVLAAALGRGKVFLDLKGSDGPMSESIVREARHLNATDIIAASGNWSHLDRLNELLPGVQLYYSVGNRTQIGELQQRLVKRQVPGVSIDSLLLTRALVDELRGGGVEHIVTWHVDAVERAEEVLGWGVDGITSGNLELLVAVRGGTVGRAGR